MLAVVKCDMNVLKKLGIYRAMSIVVMSLGTGTVTITERQKENVKEAVVAFFWDGASEQMLP